MTPTQATQTLVRIISQENLISYTLTLTIAPSLSVGLIVTKLHACFNVCLHISSVVILLVFRTFGSGSEGKKRKERLQGFF